jgi:chemotaxis protein MotB
MSKLKTGSLLLLVFALTGCMWKSDYNARLADIDNLKKNVSTLDDQLKKSEADKAALQTQLSSLQKDYADLQTRNKVLSDDNTNLDNLLKAKKGEMGAQIIVLREQIAEKEMALNAKNAEIETLTQEKEKALQEKEKSIAEMKKTYNSLVGEMNEEIKKGEITITQLKDKLTVNMMEQTLFDSGSAEIKKSGKKVLDRVAEILIKVTDKQVRVEGHTDNVPIGPRIAGKFRTNWELSTARATTVARYLQDKGIDPKLLSAAGYFEYRPVASNDTEEGRATNRRIEIALIPKEIDSVTPPEGPNK